MNDMVVFETAKSDDTVGSYVAINLNNVAQVSLEYQGHALALNPGGRLTVEYTSGNIRKFEFDSVERAREVFEMFNPPVWPLTLSCDEDLPFAFNEDVPVGTPV